MRDYNKLIDAILKLSEASDYIMKVIESCKTSEQYESIKDWVTDSFTAIYKFYSNKMNRNFQKQYTLQYNVELDEILEFYKNHAR